MKMRRGQRKEKKGERSGGEEEEEEAIWRREKFPECQDRPLLPRVLRIASLLTFYTLLYTMRYLPEYAQLLVLAH